MQKTNKKFDLIEEWNNVHKDDESLIMESLYYEVVKKNIELESGNVILDIGCGKKSPIEFMNSDIISIGFDISLLAIELQKNHELNNQHFFVADAENISLNNETINIISALGVLEHVSDPDKTIMEIYRVLKNDGICIVALPNRNRFVNIFMKFINISNIFLGGRIREHPTQPIEREYTSMEGKDLFKNGFKVIWIMPYNPKELTYQKIFFINKGYLILYKFLESFNGFNKKFCWAYYYKFRKL